MQYPSKEDYLKAVQRSESFTSDELRRAEFVLHPVWQIPKPAAGTSAVVFKAVVDGEEQALRFFTRDDASSSDRYEALQEHFTVRDLVSCVAMSHWVDGGIRINGRTWPVVRMQWVNGRTLNQYVDHLVEQEDTGALGSLASAWRELVVRLQEAEFAHGDLQHGNVLVDDCGVLRLVDFDCSWIVRFAGQPAPSETGHRNYQPENRPWGCWMDTFPGLVIYTSLLTLSKNPRPWHALNTGENLLFRREDFSPPFDTPAWKHVSSIRDPQLDQLAAWLKECCTPGWSARGGLDELLAPRALPWWELTGKAGKAGKAVAGPTPVRPTPPPPSKSSPLPPPPATADVPASSPSPQYALRRPSSRKPGGHWWDDARARNAPGPPSPTPGPTRPGAGRGIGRALGKGLVVVLVVVGLPLIASVTAIGLIVWLLAAFIALIVRVTRT
jgi:eukaryotic-like serine/threonine-protein kinase